MTTRITGLTFLSHIYTLFAPLTFEARMNIKHGSKPRPKPPVKRRNAKI